MNAAPRTTIATVTALLGFAANSLLCRAALGADAIDAWSFTFVRLASGAVVLALLARAASAARGANDTGRPVVHTEREGSWASAAALFAYAAAFSLAYLRLGAGVGALVLFACVQATMIGWNLRSGVRPSRPEWIGLAIALAGLALLTVPGASAPDPLGVGLMACAGVAWGVYSLRGRTSRTPLAATAANFARSVPMALAGLALGFALSTLDVSRRGAVLALLSGAIASGLGYSLWYLALPGLGATRAAVVQLVVPVLAAVLGVLLLGERATPRLLLSGAAILGGVGVALWFRGARAPHAPTRASATERDVSARRP